MTQQYHPGVVLKDPKDPSDVIDEIWDWTTFLDDDAIDTVTAVGEDITVDSVSNSSNVITVWMSGGQAGCRGKVTVKVVTTNATPRTIERSFYVDVEDL